MDGALFAFNALAARASGKCGFQLPSLAVQEGTQKGDRSQVTVDHTSTVPAELSARATPYTQDTDMSTSILLGDLS